MLAAAFLLLSCAGSPGTNGPKAGKWSFAVLCDTRGDNDRLTKESGINAEIIERIVEDVVANKCEFVLVPGDMILGSYYKELEDGSEDKEKAYEVNEDRTYKDKEREQVRKGIYEKQMKEWKAAMAPVYDQGIKVYIVRGNHENGRLNKDKTNENNERFKIKDEAILKELFLEYFGKDNPQNGPAGEKGLTYSFGHKNAFVLGLDNYIQPFQVNLPWVEEQLTKNYNKMNTPHLFLFGHEPAYQVQHKDCLAVEKEKRNQFWNAIGSAGGKTYFCGHDHFYNRAAIKDEAGNEIQQVLVGSGGAILREWNGTYGDPAVVGKYSNYTDYGYLVVTIDGDSADFQWKNLLVEDKFSY